MPGKHNAGGCGCCACVCGFTGGFVYNDAGLLGSVCLLQFSVGNLEDSSCATIDVETADITIVLKKNGTTITEPLIYDTVNNVIYWERWKPTEGDVYTADVELTCGSDVVTQSYSFTIPTPANTSCVCCNERIPDYIVISGMTDCCTYINGTFALNLTGGSCDLGTKNYSAQDSDVFPEPSDPCVGACLTVTQSNGDIIHCWKRGYLINVVMPATLDSPETITISVNTSFRFYKEAGGTGGACTLFNSSGGTQYVYEIDCASGVPTLTFASDFANFASLSNKPYVCNSVHPTVELFIA